MVEQVLIKSYEEATKRIPFDTMQSTPCENVTLNFIIIIIIIFKLLIFFYFLKAWFFKPQRGIVTDYL